MSLDGEPTPECGKNPTTIEEVKGIIKEFLENLDKIANNYDVLWRGMGEISVVDDEIYKKFIKITKEYVEVFHKGKQTLDKAFNNYKNNYKFLSLKQNISETLDGTKTSENIIEKIENIEKLIKQLEEEIFDKYLTYTYNENTGEIEYLGFKIPLSDYEIEHKSLKLKIENIDFGNSNSKNLLELFFIKNRISRIRTMLKTII